MSFFLPFSSCRHQHYQIFTVRFSKLFFSSRIIWICLVIWTGFLLLQAITFCRISFQICSYSVNRKELIFQVKWWDNAFKKSLKILFGNFKTKEVQRNKPVAYSVKDKKFQDSTLQKQTDSGSLSYHPWTPSKSSTTTLS